MEDVYKAKSKKLVLSFLKSLETGMDAMSNRASSSASGRAKNEASDADCE
jgi:hypothetical protein|tara:strand:+ start:1582 stop:1731 length:150 start_codon:yes stop_codon:yes gene_type:complete